MTTKAGVWIDHQKAVVVLVSDTGTDIKKINFDVGQPTGRAARLSLKNKHKPSDFIAEDKRERKVASDRKDFYNDVIAGIRGADALLIMGPGEAKGELGKQIKAKKVRVAVAALETSDRMSERQVAAKVASHFSARPVRKSAVPKVVTAKKPASASRTKKNAK